MIELTDVLWYGAWVTAGLWLLLDEMRRHPSLDELARRARNPGP